jgi:hypothetical protein
MSGDSTPDPRSVSVSGDTADEAFLRFSLLSYLRSDSAQKIDFWCNGIHVDAAGLMSVYNALVSGKVHVKVDSTLPADLAKYWAPRNTFFFGSADYGYTALGRGLMIHESIHAMTDIAFEPASVWGKDDSARADRYRPALKMLEEEVICYVTQGLYLLYENADVSAVRVPVVLEGLRIARQIKDQDGAVVSDLMQPALQAAIIADPMYRDELRDNYWTIADGVS